MLRLSSYFDKLTRTMCRMSLRSPAENENTSFVMPAWIAGIQFRKDASGDSSTPCWNDALWALLQGRHSFQAELPKEISNEISPSPVSGEARGEGSQQNPREV